MKQKYLVSTFLKEIYQNDSPISDKRVQKALQTTNKQFLKQTSPLHSQKELIRYYFTTQNGRLVPNEKNYELLDFWDAYAPFHSRKAPDLPLLRRIYEIRLLNYKTELEQQIFFKNHSASGL